MPSLPEIVVAEDNLRDRQFLQTTLADFALLCARDGAEALTLIEGRDAPYVISDIQMPGRNGIELARQLWAQRPQARMLFWTQHDDEMYVRALAKIIPAETVYGYVLKDNPAETVRKAAYAVFVEQQCWIDPKLRAVHARTQHRGSALNDGEYAVLLDIALGLTDAAIAERHYLSRRGAQNRLKSLYVKLGVDETQADAFNLRARAIGIALRRGLLNADELAREEERLRDWLRDGAARG